MRRLLCLPPPPSPRLKRFNPWSVCDREISMTALAAEDFAPDAPKGDSRDILGVPPSASAPVPEMGRQAAAIMKFISLLGVEPLVRCPPVPLSASCHLLRLVSLSFGDGWTAFQE